jgi:hypothetical protein
MSIYTPYVYCIIHKNNGIRYIGSRTCKKANPEDLFTKYFTSSNIIKQVIKKEGKQIFDIEWIIIQQTSEEAIALEAKILKEQNAALSVNYYNCTNGDANFNPTKTAKLRVENGTHHLLKANGGSKKNREQALVRVKNGTHNWISGESQRQNSLKRLADGTHHFLDPVFQEKMCKLSKEINALRIEKGEHNFTSEFAKKRTKRLLQEGTHVFLANNPNKVIVTCPHCNKSGGRSGMIRWHYDNCKSKVIISDITF